MNSKILLTNYPRVKQYVQFEEVITKKLLDVVIGYDININNQHITEQIASDLITALLTYDTIYVEGNHILDIIQVFGSNYLKELLRLHLIQIIPDQNLNPAIKKEDAVWTVGFFAYPQGNSRKDKILQSFQPHKWSHIENYFSKKDPVGQETKTLIYLIDENSVNVNESDIARRVDQETILDLHNPLLLNQFNLVNPTSGKLADADFPKLLRLQELNKTSVLASILDIDSIKTDAEISSVLALKSLSILNNKYGNGITTLNKIEYEKGFPDLGKLFVDNVIGLDDILKLRNSFQGKIFRYWAQNTEYEENLMRQEVMNSVHNVLGNSISNAIRMVGCNLLGLAGFLPGVMASSIDSFILSKVANGWHPNFFLDNKVKHMIDKCIETKEEEQKRELLRSSFKGIGRNVLCPCGSGRKFKKCHGKNL